MNKEHIGSNFDELYEKIVQLKAENEKYKQALKDARKIAESIYQVCDDECWNAGRIRLITDKINEVLKDE